MLCFAVFFLSTLSTFSTFYSFFLQAPSFREIDYFLFKIHMLYCVYCVEFLHTIYFKEGSVTYGTFDNL